MLLISFLVRRAVLSTLGNQSYEEEMGKEEGEEIKMRKAVGKVLTRYVILFFKNNSS